MSDTTSTNQPVFIDPAVIAAILADGEREAKRRADQAEHERLVRVERIEWLATTKLPHEHHLHANRYKLAHEADTSKHLSYAKVNTAIHHGEWLGYQRAVRDLFDLDPLMGMFEAGQMLTEAYALQQSRQEATS